MQDLTPMPSDAPWWARWLSENWRSIWSEFSTWFITAAGVLAGLAEVPGVQSVLTPSELHYMTLGCAVAALFSKYVKQKGS